MGKKLFIGNLPFSADDAALRHIFSQAGTVESAKVIFDRDTGRSKGFGFVEMSNDAEAQDAVAKFNGADYEGRAMNVAEARPMQPRDNSSRPSFGGGAGGGGGYGMGRSSNRY